MPVYQNTLPPISLFSGDVGFSFNNEAFTGAATSDLACDSLSMLEGEATSFSVRNDCRAEGIGNYAAPVLSRRLFDCGRC